MQDTLVSQALENPIAPVIASPGPRLGDTELALLAKIAHSVHTGGGAFGFGSPRESTVNLKYASQIVPVPSTTEVLTSSAYLAAEVAITNETGVAVQADFNDETGAYAVIVPAGTTFHAELGGEFFTIASLTALAAPTAAGSRVILNFKNAHDTV